MIAMESRGKFSKDNILKNGSIEVHVKVSGIRQRHTLKVEREKTAFGMVPYLVCEKSLPVNELLRLAEELQFPIKCKGMKVFPKGKAAKDFAESDPEKKKSLSHDRIMNDKKSPEAKKSGKETGKESEAESEEQKNEEIGAEEESAENAEPDEEESGEEPADEETEKSEENEEENEEQEEEKEETGTDEKEAEPGPGQEGKKIESIEIEGSSDNMKKNDTGTDAESSTEDKPEEKKEKKKVFSGVLSEGILT